MTTALAGRYVIERELGEGGMATVYLAEDLTLHRRIALKAARDAAEKAARIVRAQQREGQVDGLVLLDAERSFAETEAQLAAIDAGIAAAQIDLFKALAGGWSDRTRS